MEWSDVFKIVTASLGSIGVGGAIVFGLSSWLGRVWATRILENQRHILNHELEKTIRELDVIKETTLRFQNDKIVVYRSVVDVVAKILSYFDAVKMGRLPMQDEATALLNEVNEQRIRVYGYLAMLAPQNVMDTQDALMDFLFEVANGQEKYNWPHVRDLAIAFLNAVRVDIGIDKTPIMYQGRL